MTEREKMILSAIIKHYLDYGESVGSRTLEKKYKIGVSSATIRNVMSDLEDQGYISKTHTSSGRVPTNVGYKLYTEELIKIRKLTLEEKEKIHKAYESRMSELDEVFEQTSRLLSSITSYAGVVMEPEIINDYIQKVSLVHITNYVIMAVVVLENTTVRTKKIFLNVPVNEQEVQNYNELLNEKLKEKDFRITIIELENILKQADKIRMESLSNDLQMTSESKLFLEGSSSLLGDNPQNLLSVVNRVKFLDNREDLKSVFTALIDKNEYDDGEVNIVFGEDFNIEELKDLSFVFSVYTLGLSKGIIGVIGPKRMEYSKIMSMVEYISGEVNRVISKINKGEWNG